jgi:hypothetical protein
MGIQYQEIKKHVDPRLILWAWGPLEADFWRYYKIDLQQEGLSDRLTWRRFQVLVRGLPADSAFSRWLQDTSNRDLAEWSEEAVFEGARKGGVR